MSTRVSTELGLPLRTIGNGAPRVGSVDESDWIPLPAAEGEQFIGLAAINEHSTFFHFTVVTTSGSNATSEGFTVDWGDGTIETFTSGSTVNYLYEYSLASADTGVYKQALITITPIGDDKLESIDLTTPHSIPNLGTKHNSPWLALSLASKYLTSFHVGAGSNSNVDTLEEWVDLDPTVYMRNLESVYMRCPAITSYDKMFNQCTGLRDFDIDFSYGTSFVCTFAGCWNLDRIPDIYAPQALDLSYMFRDCLTLKDTGTLSFPSATTVYGMFYRCIVLRGPRNEQLVLNIPNVTDASYILYGCQLVKDIELISAKILNFDYAFRECLSLTDVEIDVGVGTSFRYTFYYCASITTLPDWEFTAGIDFYAVFYRCISLLDLPVFTFPEARYFKYALGGTSIRRSPKWAYPKVTDVSFMFEHCTQLQYVEMYLPALTSRDGMVHMFAWTECLDDIVIDTPVGPPIDYAFAQGVTTVPAFTLTAADQGNVNSLFYECRRLKEIPAIDFSEITAAGSTTTSLFYAANEITRIQITNISTSFRLTFCELSAPALEELFSNLATLATPGLATITISGNPGASTADKTIATNKNWTVVG